MPSEEHTIMADALEAEAHLQEQGLIRRIGEAYDPTLCRILEVNANYDESVSFAFTFWDEWVDAANHGWQYHEPFSEQDWPRFAHEVAQAVRRGERPVNKFLVEHICPKPRRSLWQWFKALFRHAA